MKPDAPLFFVFNIAAGAPTALAVRAAITRACDIAGRRYQIIEVDDPQRITEVANEAVRLACLSHGIVVAAGGDGTINAVAQAALEKRCALGVLPQGTFNYFSRAHGIPAEVDDALKVVLYEAARPVQVGLVNDKVFLVNASLGLYPKLLEDREAWKAQLGRSRLVAFGAGMSTLLRGDRDLRLRIEFHGIERDVRTPTLFVGNNALQMTQLGFAEASAIDDGQLAGIMLKPVSHFGMLTLLVRGAFGKLGAADNVVNFAFRNLTVQTRRTRGARPIKVATDGEISWQTLPLSFRVSPEPLMLICPAPPAQSES